VSRPGRDISREAGAGERTGSSRGPQTVPHSTPTEPDLPAQPPARGWVLQLSVLVLGSFMSVLDSSIVNVAIPTMQRELGVTADDVAWVVTAYVLALGVVVPLTGWLSQRMGQALLYVVGISGFALASALCGLAWNLGSLVAFRVLQAVPGGILPVVTLTMVYQFVPRDRIGAAMGLYGLGVVVAPAIGPTLGGLLVDSVNWRLIFFINVPIGVLAAVAAFAVFPRTRPTSWPRLDVWGFVTAAYGLFALLLAFHEGESWGWTGYRVLILFVSGVLSLALFVVIELEVDHPLIDLRVFRSWSYTLSLLLLAIAMTALFTGLYFIPQFLQLVLGQTALESGLTLLPAALVMMVLMPFAGRIYDAVGPRYPVVIGLLVIAYGSYLLAGMTPSTPVEDIELWLSLRNAGIGVAMMPMFTAGVSSLSSELTPSGSAMNNIVQRVASAVSVAVFSALNVTAEAQLVSDWGSLLHTGPQALPEVARAQQQGPAGVLGLYGQLRDAVITQTYDNGFAVSAVLSLLGAALALMLRSGRPTATAGTGT